MSERKRSAQEQLQAGDRVSRFLILERIGQGGMGVVYQAYDPELDRRVALKLLPVGHEDSVDFEHNRQRLLREAKALAQLAHPNVVPAFDLGTFGENVFVAMEMVAGKTLREWIKTEQPTVWEKVDALLAAGRGIAAAHKVGLIHRDIKPDNIIVGDDGRARVLDFGLARTALIEQDSDGSDFESNSDAMEGNRQNSLGAAITRDSRILGTPGYLAPEQYRGQGADELADQYSFSVTMYEALFGQKPIEETHAMKLRTMVCAGRFDPLPPSARVPAHYRRIVFRGLSLAKDKRYPSMTELLAELAKDPRQRRRRLWLVMAVLVLVVISFFGAYALQAQRQQKCAGAADKLIGVWDEPIKQQVKAAFLRTGRPYAQETFIRVERGLSERSRQWVSMHTEACEATHLRGEQSTDLLDKRMQCLKRQLSAQKALIELFVHRTDGEVLDRSIQAVAGLGRLILCADTSALTTPIQTPDNPALRVQVSRLRQGIDKAGALLKAGKYADGLQELNADADDFLAVAYPPLQAEFLLLRGSLLLKTGEWGPAESDLRRAVVMAAASQYDRALARAKLILIEVLGTEQGRYPEAREAAHSAQASILRGGGDPELMTEYHNNLGILLWRCGKLDQARESLQQALQILKTKLKSKQLMLARTLNNLANVISDQEQFEQAQVYLQRSLALFAQSLGPAHPTVGITLNNLGTLARSLNNIQAAVQYYRRTLAIWESALGPDHPLVGTVLCNLGNSLRDQKEFDPAWAMYQRALAIWQKKYPPDHPDIAYAHNQMAILLFRQKKFRVARQHFAQALAILERGSKLGRLEAFQSLNGIGGCLLELGEYGPAQVTFERTLALLARGQFPKTRVAEAKFNLAKTLWLGGQNRKRALALAQQARAIFVEAGDLEKEGLKKVDDWLKNRRKR